MDWLSLNTLREKFLSFFESKDHLRLDSFPLIPKDDNSLLLINAGMAPLKKYFTGEVTPPKKRVTTCQKCIRTPDIERVGKTARHGTFFEMLGNFSFGDYFKKEVTAWAWEFVTKVLEMPVDKLWITIYENDDEAFDIWTKNVGVDPSHIVRLGKEDNFWELGQGPCGPCSEIYYDRGEEYGCNKPTCGVGCDCDRYVEFWNLVFTQFNSDGKGNYTPLAHPNIDTGMGLERLACISQGVDNLFEVDTIKNIMSDLSEMAKVEYKKDEKNDISLRVITDHIRSTTFMISDGVLPSNEGRGYVLRRLLRRAARHGRLIGINEPFLYKLCNSVIRESKSAYPELEDKSELIQKIIFNEEENFGKTIDQGLNILNELMQKNVTTISGVDAFKLYDTYGFPLDLTKDILEEKGITVDEQEFNSLMDKQKQRARDARKNSNIEGWKDKSNFLKDIKPTLFSGYEKFTDSAEILAFSDDCLVVDKTCFYAESGGQVADTGVIEFSGGRFEVSDVVKTPSGVFIHKGSFVGDMPTVGAGCTLNIDIKKRQAIMRNHTAAHLLQAALRKTLGNHVEQAGQYVNEKTVRFDFTHFSALTSDEIQSVENTVNEIILNGVDVTTEVLPIEEARKKGAIALFGEKYGKNVRVVSVGDYSVEFCGGTHVDNSSKICLFKILTESSVASGVRRIEAVTGAEVISLLDNYKNIAVNSAANLKVQNVFELPEKALQFAEELKSVSKKLAAAEQKLASSSVDDFIKSAKNVNGFDVICHKFKDTEVDKLRQISDLIKDKCSNVIVVFAAVNVNKLTFLVSCGKDAVKNGANAGKIVKSVAQVAGGNGGGKPDTAMAGGKDVTKADEALKSVFDFI